MHAIIAEQRRLDRRLTAIAGPGFHAAVDGVPRKQRVGRRGPALEADGDLPGRHPAGEHRDRHQANADAGTLGDFREAGPAL